jgi:hypothetical protein
VWRGAHVHAYALCACGIGRRAEALDERAAAQAAAERRLRESLSKKSSEHEKEKAVMSARLGALRNEERERTQARARRRAEAERCALARPHTLFGPSPCHQPILAATRKAHHSGLALPGRGVGTCVRAQCGD